MLFKHVIQKLFIVVHGSFLQCNVPLYYFPEAQYLLGFASFWSVWCSLIFFKSPFCKGSMELWMFTITFTMSFDLALSMPCCMFEVVGRDLLVLWSSMLFKHVIQHLLCQYEAIWPVVKHIWNQQTLLVHSQLSMCMIMITISCHFGVQFWCCSNRAL